jgi:hypothetical protein
MSLGSCDKVFSSSPTEADIRDILECVLAAFDAGLGFGISSQSAKDLFDLRLDLGEVGFSLFEIHVSIPNSAAEKLLLTCSSSKDAQSIRPGEFQVSPWLQVGDSVLPMLTIKPGYLG